MRFRTGIAGARRAIASWCRSVRASASGSIVARSRCERAACEARQAGRARSATTRRRLPARLARADAFPFRLLPAAARRNGDRRAAAAAALGQAAADARCSRALKRRRGRRDSSPAIARPRSRRSASTGSAPRSAGSSAFLLHGVTGSGKTEVYLRLIAQVLERGRAGAGAGSRDQPHAAARGALPARLPGRAASRSCTAACEDVARTAAWLAGRARRSRHRARHAARGARAAAAARRSIVVDEEHDAFVQAAGRPALLRRATWRCTARKLAGCPVVLGTATPSLETWHNCARRTLRAARAARARRRPARSCRRCARSTCAPRASEHGLAAGRWSRRSAARLARGEQSLVFINRRGYAPVLACEACGWAAGCERCTRAHGAALGGPAAALPPLRRRERRSRAPARPAATSTCRPHGPRHAARRGDARPRASRGARIVRIDRDSARRRAELARTLEGVAPRRGRHPGRHAAARQGPRLPGPDAGRRAQRRQRAALDRLPRRRAPVRDARAGGGPRRAARAAGRGAGADALSGASAVPRAGAPRLRRLRRVAARRARSARASRRSCSRRPCAPKRRSSSTAMRFLRSAARSRRAPDGGARATTRCRTCSRAAPASSARSSSCSPRRARRCRSFLADLTGASVPRFAARACAGISTSIRSSSTRGRATL